MFTFPLQSQIPKQPYSFSTPYSTSVDEPQAPHQARRKQWAQDSHAPPH